MAKKQRIENQDRNCRLRHGLNANCLARIFQYLDIMDLYTVGEMNVVYNQIIKDLVIPKHDVNLTQLFSRNIANPFIERYGTKIRKFYFINDNKDEFETLNQQLNHLNQLVTQHCSIDQLRDVTFFLWEANQLNNIDFENIDVDGLRRLFLGGEEEEIINFPSYFQRVERFWFSWNGLKKMRITVSLTECLRHLHLGEVILDPKFDWIKLVNLTELSLLQVRGINSDNFIEFLRQRPNLEVFVHNNSFENSTVQNIFDAMGTYCGDKVRSFSNQDNVLDRQDYYNFLSKFKKLKNVNLNTIHMCCSDLIDPIKRMAENNTIESLGISYFALHNGHDANCIFQRQPNHEGLDMKYFKNLKEISVSMRVFQLNIQPEQCDAMKLFNVYSSQILLNVERLTIRSTTVPIFELIKYVPKLRELILNCEHSSDEAAKILSMVGNILEKRNTGQTNNDFIEIILENELTLDNFTVHGVVNSSIKLFTRCQKSKC